MDKETMLSIDLTNTSYEFEVASLRDKDLMHIRCYAVSEGKNKNGLFYPRKILMASYKSFVDKPVIIVPNKFDNPTGHAFDPKKQKFDMKKRINIGHIHNAFPVVVHEDGSVREIYSMEDLEIDKGDLRIVVDLVVYKDYFSSIADRLKLLHNLGNLSFSMEAITNSVEAQGGKVVTDIKFIGLCIVDTPADEDAKSIEVAQKQKEEEVMDYEKAYNDLLAEFNGYKAEVEGNKEVAELQTQLDASKEELADVKEELANAKTEIAELNSTVESLNVYKEKVELAEKEVLGQERAAKLAKLNVTKEVAELADLSKEEFADMLIEAAENFVPEKKDEKDIHVANVHNVNLEGSTIKQLKEALSELSK